MQRQNNDKKEIEGMLVMGGMGSAGRTSSERTAASEVRTDRIYE